MNTRQNNPLIQIGAQYQHNGSCEFCVWSPLLQDVTLEIVHPSPRRLAMVQDEFGYWRVVTEDIGPGTRYWFDLRGARKRPDPASFYQPEGVHGPSAVINHRDFPWGDTLWSGIPLDKMIIYELHVGTFTPEGTFEALIARLPALKDLGINAVELMPVSQFPGARNWGYDGVYPFAVQNSYGGPGGLKRLVDACHESGLAVILDVVYNHLGPEGNYLGEFGPYFTERYRTPWGRAINFDGAYSDGVRNYFVSNALYWFQQYHCDALRLDAVHGIFDFSAQHILEELSEAVEHFSAERGRKYYLIAESDLNNPRIIRSRAAGGYGIDAQWSDDFHHVLHALLTGEQGGYYVDFGSINHLKTACEQGYIYAGRYSAFRKRRHGAPAGELPPWQFVVCSQNHDQVGNRMLGERLAALIGFEGLKLAAGTVFLSPYLPLLFMGEEYGEESPFLYFIDHDDPELIKAVREGRKKEFGSFAWHREPPDPKSLETFRASTLKWENRVHGMHQVMLNFYRELIRLKTELTALRGGYRVAQHITADDVNKVMTCVRTNEESSIYSILNFSTQACSLPIDIPQGRWNKLLDSADARWSGPGALLPDVLSGGGSYVLQPLSCALYTRSNHS